jgi:hypothetical protein
VLQKYSVDQIKGTDFDRDSIMLYEFPAAWTLDGYSTHANAVLSEADRAFIGGVIYPRGDTPQVDRLEIDGAPKNAAIGSIGEEDLYSFDVVAAGRFAVATEGGTDLVMKVYGPDDQLRLIGADDDGGAGFNPRIAADLIPGRYFVQIRHYDDAGVGEYSIDIRTA